MPDIMNPASRYRQAAIVYGAAFLQGLTLVSFPASGVVFKEMLGFTDAQYGAIFLPQVALAIAGSVLGALFARRTGLRNLLVLGLAANALSQLVLSATPAMAVQSRFPGVLAGTGLMGFGFGLAGAPLNSLPALFFPGRAASALVALHTLLGFGLALGPVVIGHFIMHEFWSVFPLLLFMMCTALAVAAFFSRLPHTDGAVGETETAVHDNPFAHPLFWAFVAAAVIYAFAEGTFSNWIVIYLREAKHLPVETGALALSVFWGALVAGRLLVSALVLRMGARSIWLALPVLMFIAFLSLPHATTSALGVGLFALAGLACSAFFPLTVTLAAQAFPKHSAWVSSLMIAALMAGVGLGSFAIGALRKLVSFELLYQLSAAYPLLILAIAYAMRPRTVTGGEATPAARPG